MACTRKEFDEWVKRGKEQNATHMIVVCDTFDYEDYPVYCNGREHMEAQRKYYSSASMQRIMEVIDLV